MLISHCHETKLNKQIEYRRAPKSVHLRNESKSVHFIQNAYLLYEVHEFRSCMDFWPARYLSSQFEGLLHCRKIQIYLPLRESNGSHSTTFCPSYYIPCTYKLETQLIGIIYISLFLPFHTQQIKTGWQRFGVRLHGIRHLLLQANSSS